MGRGSIPESATRLRARAATTDQSSGNADRALASIQSIERNAKRTLASQTSGTRQRRTLEKLCLELEVLWELLRLNGIRDACDIERRDILFASLAPVLRALERDGLGGRPEVQELHGVLSTLAPLAAGSVVACRDGTRGETTGKVRVCRSGGCLGAELEVRWSGGRCSWWCTKELEIE